MTRRERVYRALLGAYPRRFREQHAECMLGTLLDGVEQRGALAEVREVAALGAGALRARGEESHRLGRGAWRHGVGSLLAPLAAVNLAVMAAGFWSVQHSNGLGAGVSRWWLLATLAAVGLVAAVAFRHRIMVIVFALAGLIPVGYDEWLQATGRGNRDHFFIATYHGFQGPQMSPFWLFLAGVIVVAGVAWTADASKGRPSRRLAALLAASLVIGALIPVSLYVLLAVALVGTAVSVALGGLDRRLHGAGLALWLISLPYVAWWGMDLTANPVWPVLVFLAILPATGAAAWIARRRRGGLVA